MADEQRGVQLLNIGRRDEAISVFVRALEALPVKASNFQRAVLSLNLGWGLLMALESGDGTDISPKVPLEEAQMYFGDTGKTARFETKRERVNILVNLALAAFHRDQIDLTWDYIERAKNAKARQYPRLWLWILDIEGRLLASKGNSISALKKYLEMERFAGQILSTDGVYRALVARAEILQKTGQLGAAVKAFKESEIYLDKSLKHVGLTDGRAAFVAQRQRAIHKHLEALLKLKQTEEALTLVRRANRRLLSNAIASEQIAHSREEDRLRWEEAVASYRQHRETLASDAKDDWRLTKREIVSRRQKRFADEHKYTQLLDLALAGIEDNLRQSKDFSPIQHDESLLSLARDSEGWVVLAADIKGATASRLKTRKKDRLEEREAETLLARVKAKLLGKKVVRIVSTENVEGIDLHAVTVDGAPLIAHVPVVYSMDMPKVEKNHDRSKGTQNPVSVVVSDPEGNLVLAREEGLRIVKVLNGEKKRTVLSFGKENATFQNVYRNLEAAQLFHFAGHGESNPIYGWGSSLRLSAGGVLQPSDILSLSSAPRNVVLLGCNTGKSRSENGSVLGVAQAFVVRGSEVVIATSRDLSDRTAAAFAERLYHNLSKELSMGEAARKALLTLRKQVPDWSAIRIFAR